MATSSKKSRAGTTIEANGSHESEDNNEEKMDEDMIDDQDSESTDSDTEDDDGMEIEEKINVEFEARNPEEMDFHGIRQLLLQLFLKSSVDLSAFTDWILNQKYVGSVIKQYLGDEDEEGDDDSDDTDANQVYGVIACLNITKHKDKPCVDQLKKHLVQKLSNEKEASISLDSLLNNSSNNIGFIVNERFVNIPAQIAVPSFDSLTQEMQTAKSKGEDYNCTHYLMVAKKFRMKVSGKKRRSKKPLDPEIYSNAEEELFAEAAEFKATFSVAGERDSGVVQQWDSELEDQYEPLREVIVFKSDKLPEILNKVKQYLAQPNS